MTSSANMELGSALGPWPPSALETFEPPLVAARNGGAEAAAITAARLDGLDIMSFASIRKRPARGPAWGSAVSAALHALMVVAAVLWSQSIAERAPEPIAVEVVVEQATAAAPAPPVAVPGPAPAVAEAPPPEVAKAPETPPAEAEPVAEALPKLEPSAAPRVAETPPPEVARAPEPAPTEAEPVAEAPPPKAEASPAPVVETPPEVAKVPEPAPTETEPVAEAPPRREAEPSPTPVATVKPPEPQPTASPIREAAPKRAVPPALAEAKAPQAKAASTPKKIESPAPAKVSPKPAASRAAAKSDAPPASTGAASASATVGDYRNSVFARITAHTHYPDAALEREARGTATVRFTLDDNGRVMSVALAQSAGDPALDADAPATVRRAGPFGPPPHGAPHDYIVPIRYRPRI